MLADKIIFSKDGLEAKVELNKKAKFSNGDVVNAETVKKSYLELNKTTNRFVFLTENVRTHKRPFKLKSEQPSFQ